MKKNYIKPEGSVVAMCMNENISASFHNPVGDRFGIHYTVEGDNKYIFGDTSVPASNTGDSKYDHFYNLILVFIHNIDSNCLFDPDAE
jgi:hypothetical protein